MNNKIKKSYKLAWIITIVFMSLFNSVIAIDVDANNPDLITNCDEANVRADFYIPNNVESLNIGYPVDYMSGINKTLHILNADSTVKIWNNTSDTINCGIFDRSSNVVPPEAGKYYAIVSTDQCVVSKKTKADISKPSAQIVYNVAYKRETWFQSWTSNYYYFKESDSTQHFLSNQTKRTWWPIEYSGNECYNVYTHWCGDGTQDVSDEVCDPNDSLELWWGNGGCSSTCTAIDTTPTITIDKTDLNPADRDGGLVDTQLISYNTDAVFKITVKNNWDENLKDVRIEDPKAADCSLTNAETLPLIQAIWNNDNIFDINESFDYTCTKSNVVLDDINLATVYGIWVVSDIEVNSQDTSPFLIDPITIPALVSIDKVDANIDDLDTDIGGNDSQTVVVWSGSIFQITVKNIWNDDLINVEITDAITPACDLTIASLLIWADYTYTCTHSNSIEDFTNTVLVTAVWDLSRDTPSDADTTEVFVVSDPNVPVCTNLVSTSLTWVVPFVNNFACTWDNTSIYDIKVFDSLSAELYSSTTSTGSYNFTNTGTYSVSCFVENQITTTPACNNTITASAIAPTVSIDKTDANPADTDGWTADTQTISVWSWAVFSITVTNSWNENLNTVVITDTLAATCNRTDAETQVLIQAIWNNDNVFDVAESFNYECADPVVAVAYTNTARVDAIWITSTLPVFDEDTSGIALPAAPSCDGLSLSQSSGSSPYVSNFSCNGTLATSYRVELNGPGGLQTFNTQTGLLNINTQWNYTASCYINGLTTTQPICIQNLSYSTWGGGWGWPRCNQAIYSGNSVSCSWNSRVTSFQFMCENGVNLTKSWRNATFSKSECNAGLVRFNPSNPTAPFDPDRDFANTMNWSWAECTAYRFSTQAPSRKNCQYDPGGGWGWPDCGDWAVQTHLWEECDGTVGCFPPGHVKECRLSRTTFPNNADIKIYWPADNYIIWNTMNLYNTHSITKPYIINQSVPGSNSDYKIDQICVHKKSGNSLDWNVQCSSVGILYPWERVDFSWNITYIWNTSSISGTKDTNVLEYTIKHDWELYDWAFFAKQFETTVLKPTITTTGWWTSYVNNVWGLSDINRDGNWVVDANKNKNFVWASIGWLSSYSKWGVDSTQADSEAMALDDIVDEKLESMTNANWKNYNGIDNVYYLKWNKTLDSTFNTTINPVSLSNDNWVSKTYIVEWNLTITSNIAYAWNIAFVVKNWNLIIWNSVTSLKWTYIVIWWNVLGTSWTTDNKLNIQGSVHWKMNNLLSKRIYIKNNSNWLIDVGTIVSFGSSVFRKPAPLTAKFIAEYVESQKVAQ